MRIHANGLDMDDIQFITQRPRVPPRRARAGSTVTLDGNRSLSVESIADEVIDLTEDLGTSGNNLVHEDEFMLEKIRVSNIWVKPGAFLEVNEFPVGKYSAKFVLVRAINKNKTTGHVKIRGTPFAKSSSMLGKLPKKSNEVCMILCYDDGKPAEDAELVDITPENFIKEHELLITNALYPKLEVCFTGRGGTQKQIEEAFVRIYADDVPEPRYRVSEEALSNQWRGTRVRGGSFLPSHYSQTDFVNLDDDNSVETQSIRKPSQKYTVFDTCSGAGGVSRGAQMAGFKVKFAVDKAAEVWDTYRTNFLTTTLFKMSVDEFLSQHKGYMRVDVLHFSPPCQYFSPAHTREAAHDDENIFALYSGNQLFNKTRPRIVTVEQTSGLTHARHAEYFHMLLADFTQFGYSVRWKIVRLCTWGAAQDRKRLIIIAAAPGERLPPFPRATHSQEGHGGLAPFNTIEKTLSTVRVGDDLHDLVNVRRYEPRRQPFDANKLAGTITTGGGDLYFPDGTRELTLREWASLQGFPRNHKFLGTKTEIKRQIGNAFPPNTVQVLYRHLEQWLLKEDGMKPYQPDDDFILIDDDSDSSNSPDDVFEAHQMSPDMDDDVMEVVQVNDDHPMEADNEGDCIIVDLT